MNNCATITVLYTCDKCRLKDRPVSVEERNDEQSIEDWMYYVQVEISKDHDSISPLCHIVKFTNLKIPLPYGSGVIGKADRH